MIPADVRRRLDKDILSLEHVADVSRDIVRRFCDENGYAYAGRPQSPIKSAESVSEKLETGRFRGWSELNDLFACSIIIPTLEHQSDVLEFLKGAFVERKIRGRVDARRDPTVFTFRATRFYGSIRPSHLDADELDFQIEFEIQVRTAFEHAWIVATHDLTFKSNKIDWQFRRLASQLEASVEQMDALVASYEASAGMLLVHRDMQLERKATISSHFQSAIEDGKLDESHAPGSWGRFSENVDELLEKSTGRLSNRSVSRDQRLEIALMACDEELEQNRCPLSISLYQFVLGTLIERDVIATAFRDRFYPFVCQELADFYPKTARIEVRCDLEK